jgi:hypothetical protein
MSNTDENIITSGQIKGISDNIYSQWKDGSSYSQSYKTQTEIINNYNEQKSDITKYNNFRKSMDPDFTSINPAILEINPRDIQKNKTAEDIKNEDIQQLILQENTLFSIGIITCATLLIAGILISKSNEAV